MRCQAISWSCGSRGLPMRCRLRSGTHRRRRRLAAVIKVSLDRQPQRIGSGGRPVRGRLFATMETGMGISDLFSAADVILDASPSNKTSLLELLASEAEQRIGHSKQDILNALQDREQIGSTALGKGVAL